MPETRYKDVLWGDEFLKPYMRTRRRRLGALLDSWHGTLTDFAVAESKTPDVGYWWGERPNIGLLSAAAWRMGSRCVALEEYRADRQGYGRCDLWLNLAGLTINIEAKHVWAGTPDTAVRRARDELDVATGQLSRLHDNECGHLGLAVCFVAPEFTISGRKPADCLTHAIPFWDAIHDSFSTSRYIVDAYQCPVKFLRGFWKNGAAMAYPGVAVVMRLTFGWQHH